jgi:hypothetical protein
MKPQEAIKKLEYFSFITKTKKHKERRVVPLNKAKEIIKELTKKD